MSSMPTLVDVTYPADKDNAYIHDQAVKRLAHFRARPLYMPTWSLTLWGRFMALTETLLEANDDSPAYWAAVNSLGLYKAPDVH